MKRFLIYLHGTFATHDASVPEGDLSDLEIVKKGGELVGAGEGVMWSWSGEATGSARQKAADEMVRNFSQLQFSEDTEINIIAHSHGGNVAGHLINRQNDIQVQGNSQITFGQVILLGTPHFTSGDDKAWTQETLNQISKLWNVYSGNDKVQTTLATLCNKFNPYQIWDPKSLGGVSRTLTHLDGNAKIHNIDMTADTTRWPVKSHSQLHAADVFDLINKQILQITAG